MKDARRVILSATYAEKQQAVVDAMLLTWDEADAGEYGFTGYENVSRIILNADLDTKQDIADAILDRRADRVLA